VRWLLALSLVACSSGQTHEEAPVAAKHDDGPAPATAMPKVHIASASGDIVVEVEIVATPAKIERGLMFREHLPPDQGMLFLMDEERDWPFWMKNTLIPLDLIFITLGMTVAGVVHDAVPRTEDLRRVDTPSLYVLEVNGGYAKGHAILDGAKVRFEGVNEREPRH
jgi:uncharacterized membrane protein (UPF0127 family)